MKPGKWMRHLTVVAIVASAATASAIAVAVVIEPKSAIEAETARVKAESDRIIYLLTMREFDKALELATKLIGTDPKDPNGYNLRGAAYAGKKDLPNARKDFEEAIKLQPNYAQALFNLAQLDIQQKDLASARNRYEAILAKDPKNVEGMVGLADIETANGRTQEALGWLQKAKAADPESITARLALGSHYLRQRDAAKAMAELSDAQRSHPDDARLLDLLGQAQSLNHQPVLALATYRRLVSTYPESAAAHYRLAIAQLDNQDPSAAAESLRTAVQLKPDYVEAVDRLVDLELAQGRSDKAFRLARDLQKAMPKSPAGLTLEGDILLRQKRYADASKVYQRAFALGPSGMLVVKLHAAESRVGSREKADARLTQWLRDHPDDVGARQYWAMQNVKAGNHKLAIEQYQQVLQKAPDNALVLSDLALLYQREKDPRALSTAERAYKLVPDASETADALGWILVERGDTAKGLELLQKAAAAAPRDAQVRYHLAVGLAKSGDKRTARKELESLLAGERAFPEREAAERMLKQL